MSLSIISLHFVVTVAVVAGATTAAAVLLHRRGRVAVILAAVALWLTTAVAAANAYFAYVPTAGALFGRRARDQASQLRVARIVAVGSPRDDAPSALPSHGLVEQVDIPGTVSGFHARAAQVYLPPVWFAHSRPTLPVIELLHGTPGSPVDWTRGGFADVTADQWAQQHHGVAPILVLPDVNGSFTSDTECVDGRLGRAETYLTVDVPAWAIAHLGATADRAGWGVAGLSEGGYCAVDLALRHPDRYSAFADLSGLDHPTYSGGVMRLFTSRADLVAHTPAVLLSHPWRGPSLSGWFVAGTADGGVTRQTQVMAALARARGIAAELDLLPGGHHTFRVWHDGLARIFPAMAAQLTQSTLSAYG